MKILILLLCFILTSCSEKKPEVRITEKKDSVKKQVSNKDTASIEIKTISKSLKTATGKNFKIDERKKSSSVSDYLISGIGFGTFSDTLKIENKDPLKNIFNADLDKDGFEEVYIITQATGSGSYENIIGVASDKDKSYRLINIQEIRDKDLQNTGQFSGYMGRDSIYVSDGVLTREFPVYLKTDAMSDPSGGKRLILYALKSSGNAYEMIVVNSIYMKKAVK
ncbi:MAG: hypothetical protein ABIY50_12215 [Ignavibacteria bacterium]